MFEFHAFYVTYNMQICEMDFDFRAGVRVRVCVCLCMCLYLKHSLSYACCQCYNAV